MGTHITSIEIEMRFEVSRLDNSLKNLVIQMPFRPYGYSYAIIFLNSNNS